MGRADGSRARRVTTAGWIGWLGWAAAWLTVVEGDATRPRRRQGPPDRQSVGANPDVRRLRATKHSWSHSQTVCDNPRTEYDGDELTSPLLSRESGILLFRRPVFDLSPTQ